MEQEKSIICIRKLTINNIQNVNVKKEKEPETGLLGFVKHAGKYGGYVGNIVSVASTRTRNEKKLLFVLETLQ